MRYTKYLLALALIDWTMCWYALLAAPEMVRVRMSTTTSTENSGLLYAILPPFEKRFNVKIDVIAVGTGKALKLAENGDVDVVFVHARRAEEEFVARGCGVNRREVMYNDFIILGPRDDPAGLNGRHDAVGAFKKIMTSRANFVSRGDDSGTHKKEKGLWKAAGLRPSGNWYLEVGQGMGATLVIADEKRAYCLSDRGTFLAYKDRLDLVVCCQCDKRLFNPYGVIAVNPAMYPKSKYVYAMAIIGWLTSPECQFAIASYKKHGELLFHPLAVTLSQQTNASRGKEKMSEKVVLATGSPYELGLTGALASPFEKRFGCKVDVIKAGSGEALKLLKEGKVDIALVHSEEGEKKALEEGYAVNRRAVAHNDFVIVGPQSDPAGIKSMSDVAKAYTKIARAGRHDSSVLFFSRGDNSGTYKKEMSLWGRAGISPRGDWYKVTGAFMGESLLRADRERGYFMTDRSTFVTLKDKVGLRILFEGDPLLVNHYHALVANPARHSRRNYLMATIYVGFITSPEGQRIIAEFGKEKFGEALYVPDAIR